MKLRFTRRSQADVKAMFEFSVNRALAEPITSSEHSEEQSD